MRPSEVRGRRFCRRPLTVTSFFGGRFSIFKPHSICLAGNGKTCFKGRDLGRAFYVTGDERYAAEFAAKLKSWIHDCPVPDRVNNRPFSRWRTIEAGIRMGTVWPEVYYRFLCARSFDDGALVSMVKSAVEHARYLMRFHAKGNWLTMECNGLYHVGCRTLSRSGL